MGQGPVVWGLALQARWQGLRLPTSCCPSWGPHTLLFLLFSTYLAHSPLCLCRWIFLFMHPANGCTWKWLLHPSSVELLKLSNHTKGLQFLHLLVYVLGDSDIAMCFLQPGDPCLVGTDAGCVLPIAVTISMHDGYISKCQFLYLFVWGLLWTGCLCVGVAG